MSLLQEQILAGDAAQVAEPSLRRLYEYWLAKRGGGLMPARRDIDPLDFPYALGRIMLLDVLLDPTKFRVRLHGSDMVGRAGYDLTGKTLNDLPDNEYRSYVIDRCKSVVASGKPTLVRHDRILDNRVWRYDALWLPFSDDGANVAMLLCALVYHKDPLPETLA
jgi:hypothetical protein